MGWASPENYGKACYSGYDTKNTRQMPIFREPESIERQTKTNEDEVAEQR